MAFKKGISGNPGGRSGEKIFTDALRLELNRIGPNDKERVSDGVEASVLGERTLSPAHGTAGGAEGKPSSFVLQRAAGDRILLDAKSGPHKLAKGDRLEMMTAGGGGGWGKKV